MTTTRSGRVLGSLLVVAGCLAGGAAVAACNDYDSVTPSTARADAGAADAAASSPTTDGGCVFDADGGTRALTLGQPYTGCVTTAGATTYELTAPEDAAGGYVSIHLTNVVGAPLRVSVVSLFDKSEVLTTERSDDDAPVHGYVAVKGGTSYRVTVERKAGDDDTTRYDLAAVYTPFLDAYEPNHDLKAAKPVSLGTDISASALGNYEGKTTYKIENYWDWYSFNAAAGPLVIKVTNPDPSERFVIDLHGADGSDIATTYSPSQGADARIERTLATAGTYVIAIRLISYSFVMSGEDAVPPPIFTAPYTLRVEQ